jgi:hypothetical protein
VAVGTATGRSLEAHESITVGQEEHSVAPVVPLATMKGLLELLSVIDPNKRLTLGFTSEGWFELRGEQLSMSARLLEGRFPPRQGILPPESPGSAKVDPRLLEREVKRLSGLTTFEERDVNLTLRGTALALANTAASSSVSIPVQNLSADKAQAVTVAIEPERLLPCLAVHRSAFVLKFQPAGGWPLLYESVGFRFLLMPMKKG